MSAVRVQPAGAAHLDVLETVHGACFADAWSREFFARLLATPGAFGLLACHEGTPPAPAGLLLGRTAGGESEVLTLGVLPADRGHGVGLALLEAAMTQSRASSAAKIFLEVATDNAPARALYTKAGFRCVGRRPGYYRIGADRTDALILCRNL